MEYKTKCNHLFHSHCFANLKTLKCPCCRSEVIANLTMLINFVNKNILEETRLLELTKVSCHESLTNAEKKCIQFSSKIKRL